MGCRRLAHFQMPLMLLAPTSGPSWGRCYRRHRRRLGCSSPRRGTGCSAGTACASLRQPRPSERACVRSLLPTPPHSHPRCSVPSRPPSYLPTSPVPSCPVLSAGLSPCPLSVQVFLQNPFASFSCADDFFLRFFRVWVFPTLSFDLIASTYCRRKHDERSATLSSCPKVDVRSKQTPTSPLLGSPTLDKRSRMSSVFGQFRKMSGSSLFCRSRVFRGRIFWNCGMFLLGGSWVRRTMWCFPCCSA